MKNFGITLIMVLVVTCGYGQFFDSYTPDCGEWVVDSVYYTEWETIDTINYNSGTAEAWFISGWQSVMNPESTYDIYCPCGCGYDSWDIRKRVGRGIIQQQKRITTFRYIESAFEKRVRELRNK